MPGPYSYGRASQAALVTAHHDLQIIMADVIEVYDVQIIQGARTIEEQIRNITRGVSKTLNSDHIPRNEDGEYDSSAPAMALDVVPYASGVNPWPLDSDTPVVRQKKAHRFYYMQGIIYRVAHEHGIAIQQGIDWDMDGDLFDQSFDDLPHVALAAKLPPLSVTGDLLVMANEALRSRGLPEWRDAG
jgi:peptidoglycan L-alanyl-D-glutamate endopeptidase CwlK